jgi:hypothetical protein
MMDEMIISMITGATRIFGKDREFTGLPIRDDRDAEDRPYMVSAWEPTPDELAAIAAGAKIEVSIMGTVHPPINVRVGAVPE